MAASAGLLVFLGGKDDAVLAQAHEHDAQRMDPMLRLFIRESVAIRSEIKRDRLKGEHARRHAAALRMLATHGQQVRLDDRVRSEVREAIRRQGEEALLAAPADYDRMIAELRAHGVVEPEELPDPNLLTRDQRRAGLAELLLRGFTPALARQAELVDRGASVLDRYGRLPRPGVVPVALRQDPVTREQCEAAWDSQILMLKAFGTVICFIPPLVELCVITQLDILLAEALKWYMCSDNP